MTQDISVYTHTPIVMLPVEKLFLPEVSQRLKEWKGKLQSTGKVNVVLSCFHSGNPAGSV